MKELDYEKIAQNIKDRRIALGYSYSDLSALSGLSKSTLQRYETGHIKSIPITRLKTLSTALNMDPNELIGIEQENSLVQKKGTREWLEDLLVERGVVKPGEDLTDTQADMLIALVQLIDAWLNSMR